MGADPNPYRSPQSPPEPPAKWRAWERTRRRGRKRYVWVNGVLGWGLSVAVFWSIAMGANRGWGEVMRLLAVAVVLFPIGGYFWGRLTWRFMEKRYLAATDAADAEV